MIPSKEISQTILEFGKSVIAGLPVNCDKNEFESAMEVIITVWNAVVVDSFRKNRNSESELLNLMESPPQNVKLEIKRLIKRKKTKFANDQRGVSNFWVRESNGEFIFGCEARLDVDNVAISDTKD